MKGDKDLVILSELRKDARAQLTSMSKATGIPVSTIFDRIKGFRACYVKKYTALLDYAELGYSTQALMVLKVKKEDKAKLRGFLEAHPNVNSLYKINNGYDYIIECIFTTMNGCEGFLEQLDDLFTMRSKQVYYIIEDVEREKFLNDKAHLAEV